MDPTFSAYYLSILVLPRDALSCGYLTFISPRRDLYTLEPRLFHGHSILFIRYAALLRYCSPMRLSCLFLERRVSLSLDTVSLCDSDGGYVLLRGRTLLYGGEDIFSKIPDLVQRPGRLHFQRPPKKKKLYGNLGHRLSIPYYHLGWQSVRFCCILKHS